jgi:drug/metabolite transporter (DMT)-like permease
MAFPDRTLVDQPPSPAARSRLSDAGDPMVRLAGIGLMCAALVFFALLDATVKWLSGHVSAVEIVWARYVGQFVLTCFIVNPWTMPGVWRTSRPWLHLVRSLFLLGITLANFTALRYLQLDQTMSITFSTPFFVALLAGPLLGEWIGPRRWIAIMVGFAGILVIIRPSAAGVHPAVLASLAAAVCYALYNITTRQLAATDSTATMMFHSSAIGTLLSLLPLPWFWTVPADLPVILGMALTGIYGGAGHLLLVLAHRRAPAAVLAPFLYLQIIWMVLLGWLVFAQVPSGWTMLGAAIVIGSGLYLISRERIRHADKAIEATVAE